MVEKNSTILDEIIISIWSLRKLKEIYVEIIVCFGEEGGRGRVWTNLRQQIFTFLWLCLTKYLFIIFENSNFLSFTISLKRSCKRESRNSLERINLLFQGIHARCAVIFRLLFNNRMRISYDSRTSKFSSTRHRKSQPFRETWSRLGDLTFYELNKELQFFFIGRVKNTFQDRQKWEV